MKNLLSTALAALLFCAPALADQAPETPLVTGPNMQQTPASQILIKVPGSTIQTLGAALAASGCTTNCTLTNPTITGGSFSGGAVAATTLSATGLSTTAGITDSGGINTTSANGYQIGGVTALTASGQSGTQSTYAGLGAGAVATTSLNAVFGYGAAGVMTTGGEVAAFGALACQNNVLGLYDTCLGEHAVGHETAANSATGVGNDTQRNLVSVGNSGQNTTVGKAVLYSGGTQNSTGVGAFAMEGNSATLTVSGTITTTDTIQVTFTGSFAGSPVTVTAPMTGLTTTTQAVAAILAAAQANSTLTGPAVDCDTTTSAIISGTSTIAWGCVGTSTSGPDITITAAVTGAATETVAITNGFVGSDDIAIGYQAFQAQYATSASRIIAIGTDTLPHATSATDVDAIGQGAGSAITTGFQDFIGGSLACKTIATSGGDVCIGYNAQGTVTNLFSSVIIGSNVNGGGVGAQGGSQSVIIGATAGNASLTGGNVVAIGPNVASSVCHTGNNDLLLGTNSSTDCTSNAEGNAIHIGAGGGDIIHTTGAGTASAAVTILAGDIISGGGAVLATATTTGFFHLPFVAAAPTGVPANGYGNACVINTATQSLNCYIGSSWYHIAMTSGAN